MDKLIKHWPRIAVTLIPLVIGLLHATGMLQIGLLNRLDDIIYDSRLRATMPRTLDDRIVIVDIDEKSLAEVGRFHLSRDKMAKFSTEVMDRLQAAVMGFDIVFAEPDQGTGYPQLQALAAGEFKDNPAFVERVAALKDRMDHDGQFASAIRSKPVVLGYYLTSDRDGRKAGQLPAPVMDRAALQGRPISFTKWNGHGANLPVLAQAAPIAGFFNSIPDEDGVVRSVPLVAELEGKYYESLSLAMMRLLMGQPTVEPGFPPERFLAKYQGLESVKLRQGNRSLAIPVDYRVGLLVPYRGAGGPDGKSFKYVSASDVLLGKLPAGAFKDKIILLGATAPGLVDLRVTPVAEVYPGVEVHANILSGLLDDRVFVRPDYALGFDVVMITLAGVLLAVLLPLLSASRAVMLSVGVIGVLVGFNWYLYQFQTLVMPLATSLVVAIAAFALNMSYGYFVESRNKRELANLFRGYIPPELVDEMVDKGERYSMQATNKELTVMFCDMRGFTNLSEKMDPVALQNLLNALFTRLTEIIQANRGTTDKFMGDCVMAFWGAPVDTPQHSPLAVKAALEMSNAVRQINAEHRAKGLPEIGVGIGLNTGTMCVGNMGSKIRQSYTVIGDAVNLGSRLEGLSKNYGVDIVVSESTKKLAGDNVLWQELDRVRVKGKAQAVAIYWPLGPTERVEKAVQDELKLWNGFLKAYRAQDWDQCELHLLNLERSNAKKYLYKVYAERVASMKMLPFDPAWDGTTNFETK